MRTMLILGALFLGSALQAVDKTKSAAKVPAIAKTFTKLTLTWYPGVGQKPVTVALTEKKTIQALASFFPEVGSGKSTGNGPSSFAIEHMLKFEREKEKAITVMVSRAIKLNNGKTTRSWFDSSVKPADLINGAEHSIGDPAGFVKTVDRIVNRK